LKSSRHEVAHKGDFGGNKGRLGSSVEEIREEYEILVTAKNSIINQAEYDLRRLKLKSEIEKTRLESSLAELRLKLDLKQPGLAPCSEQQERDRLAHKSQLLEEELSNFHQNLNTYSSLDPRFTPAHDKDWFTQSAQPGNDSKKSQAINYNSHNVKSGIASGRKTKSNRDLDSIVEKYNISQPQGGNLLRGNYLTNEILEQSGEHFVTARESGVLIDGVYSEKANSECTMNSLSESYQKIQELEQENHH
jgi:hypothetical protein